MRCRLLTTGLCVALLSAGSLVAGQPDRGGQDKGTATAAASNARVLTGTVTEYKAGRFLTIRRDTGDVEVFKLDEKDLTAMIDPGVATGSKVKVTEQVSGGARSLTVELASA